MFGYAICIVNQQLNHYFHYFVQDIYDYKIELATPASKMSTHFQSKVAKRIKEEVRLRITSYNKRLDLEHFYQKFSVETNEQKEAIEEYAKCLTWMHRLNLQQTIRRTNSHVKYTLSVPDGWLRCGVCGWGVYKDDIASENSSDDDDNNEKKRCVPL